MKFLIHVIRLDVSNYMFMITTYVNNQASFFYVTSPYHMNTEKVIFAFFVILAFTLNFGFFLGDIENVDHHDIYELYAAIVVSIIATILKLGDRSQLGAVVLASSLASVIQLVIAAVIWMLSTKNGLTVDQATMASIVSFSGGALAANLVSVILLITETSLTKR